MFTIVLYYEIKFALSRETAYRKRNKRYSSGDKLLALFMSFYPYFTK